MSDPNSGNSRLGFSLLATLLIGIYTYPLLTLTLLYASGHLPYILWMVYVVAGGLGVWVQHKLPRFGANTLFRLGGALILGPLVSLFVALIIELPLLDLCTAVLWGVFSAYVGLAPQPTLRSTLMWRLQIFGVLSAIVISGASGWIEPLRPYVGTLYAAGVISFMGWLLIVYSSQLDSAILNDGKRRMVLREFARANHQRLLWMLIIIAGIGAFPSLAAWMGPLRDRLLAWIRGLFGPVSNQEPPIPPAAPNEPPMIPDEAVEPQAEPSMIWDILGWVVLGAAVVVILWLLLKLGQKALNRLMDRLKGMMEPIEKKAEPRTEYMDISETLEAPARTRKSWFRKKETPPSQDAERIRYYYRKWIDRATRQGVDIQESHTPLEAAETILYHKHSAAKQEEEKLSAILPDTYNAVRYGKKAPDVSEMTEIDRIWKSQRGQ